MTNLYGLHLNAEVFINDSYNMLQYINAAIYGVSHKP